MKFEEFKQQYEKVPVEHYPHNVIDTPLVSVCVITFQHKNYIKECLDGILMQKTDFAFEILLGEDASTDGTREICIDYAKKYSDKIRLFLHKRENNIKYFGNFSGKFNILYDYLISKSKYIAICEGDDYWTDPLKLQRQVDFLEANNDYAIVAHDVKLEFDNVEEKYPFQVHWKKNIINFEDEFNHHFIPTLSVLFQKKYLEKLPKGFEKLIIGDIPLFLYLLSQGKGGYIQEKMAVKRRNSLGITQNQERKEYLLEGMYFVWVYVKNFTPVNLVSEMNIRLAGYERALFKKKITSYNIFAFKYLVRSIIHDYKWYLKFLLKFK